MDFVYALAKKQWLYFISDSITFLHRKRVKKDTPNFNLRPIRRHLSTGEQLSQHSIRGDRATY